MKKVLISQEDIIKLHGALDLLNSSKLLVENKPHQTSFKDAKMFLDGYTKFGSDLLKWFDSQPDAVNGQVSQQNRNYAAKDIVEKCLKEIERAMNLLNEDKKSPRWHEAAVLSKMETTENE